jgi:hypothetical protein
MRKILQGFSKNNSSFWAKQVQFGMKILRNAGQTRLNSIFSRPYPNGILPTTIERVYRPMLGTQV